MIFAPILVSFSLIILALTQWWALVKFFTWFIRSHKELVLTEMMSHADGTREVFVSVHPCRNSMSVISRLNLWPSGGTSRFNIWIETLTRWCVFNFPPASYRQFIIGKAIETENSKQHTIINSWRISYLSLFLIFFPSIWAYLQFSLNNIEKITTTVKMSSKSHDCYMHSFHVLPYEWNGKITQVSLTDIIIILSTISI